MRDRAYIDRAAEYGIDDGVVCVDFGDWAMFIPLRVARVNLARFAKAIRDHDAGGRVVPFKGG